MIRRWLARIFFAALGVILLTLAAAWIHMARHPDIPPPDVSDLIPETIPIPEEGNAYPILVQAHELFDEDHWEGDIIRDFLDTGEGGDEVARYLKEKEGAYHRLELAIQQPFLSKKYPKFFLFRYGNPDANRWRRLGERIYLKSKYFRRAGRHAAAREEVVKLNRFAELLLQNGYDLHVFSAGVGALQDGLGEIRALLRTPGSEAVEFGPMLASLPETEKLEQCLHRTMKADFGKFHAFVRRTDETKSFQESFTPGRSPKLDRYLNIPFFSSYLFQPNRTIALAADGYRIFFERLEEEADSRNLEKEFYIGGAYGTTYDIVMRGITAPNFFGEEMARVCTPVFWRVHQFYLQLRASLGATRLLYALSQFEQDVGHLPEELGLLVPNYLDKVPLDPFDGQPFRYDPDRGTVYSIGKDRVDQGGSTAPGESMYGSPTEWNAEDQIYSLRLSFQELRAATQSKESE